MVFLLVMLRRSKAVGCTLFEVRHACNVAMPEMMAANEKWVARELNNCFMTMFYGKGIKNASVAAGIVTLSRRLLPPCRRVG
jgi:hypothetical protein